MRLENLFLKKQNLTKNSSNSLSEAELSQTSPKEKSYKLEDMVAFIQDGHLSIPDDNMLDIPDNFFDAGQYYNRSKERQQILSFSSVRIPGTVRHIGVRAFAECKNLRESEICEEDETIEQHIFN